MSNELTIHSDGAARGNPGPAGIGVVLTAENGEVVQRIARALGRRTNNQAEYEAVIAGLEAAHARRARRVVLYMDSELVARQLRGEYKVKDSGLRELYIAAKKLIAGFERVRIHHVPRARNAAADQLANEAIDGALKQS